MKLEAVIVVLSAALLSGCTPKYVYPYPYEQVYVHADSYCGGGQMFGDDVYVNSFGISKSKRANEDVVYVGEVHRVDLFALRNSELRRANEELFAVVQEDLESKGEPEHLSSYTQRLMAAHERCQ